MSAPSERRRRTPVVHGVVAALTLVVALLNAWLWTHRHDGFAFAEGAYETIYVPRDQPLIQQVAWDGAALRLGLALDAAATLEIRGPRATSVVRDTGGVRIRPMLGIERFEVTFQGADRNDRAMDAAWTQRTPGEAPLLASPRIRVGEVPQFSLTELVADVHDYRSAHVERARGVLSELGVSADLPPRRRFAKLWAGLHGQLDNHRGPQPRETRRMAAWDLYEGVIEGRITIQCAGFSEILTFFATIAGIPARTVDILRTSNGVPLAAHTFVEIFDGEHGRWAYTDLNLGVMRILGGADGPPLNAVQLTEAHRAGIESLLHIERLGDGGPVVEPYLQHATYPSMFLNHNGIFVFHTDYGDRYAPLARVLRYVLADEPSYCLQPGVQRHHYTLAALALAALLAIGWVVAGATLLRGRWRARRD